MDTILRKPFRVAIQVRGEYSTNVEMLNGILGFTRLNPGWITNIRMNRKEDAFSPSVFKDGLDGLITAHKHDARTAGFIRRTGIPVITIDKAARSPNVVAGIDFDNRGFARLAATHLLSRGLRHLAVVPVPGGGIWSEERTKAFISEAKRAKAESVHSFDSAEEDLPDWLHRLPKPVGIFAVNDLRAKQTSDTARSLGLRIPDEVAVIGVDNDITLCETATPALSSIRMNTAAVGFRAAEILHQAMTSRKLPQHPQKLLCTGEVIERLSTRHQPGNDWLVSRCMELIETNLAGKFTVTDLAQTLRVSRRTLETRFKATFGRTIHEEIIRMRVARAENLLADRGLPQEKIAEACGFYNASHMNVVFNRIRKALPSEFRTSKSPI